MKPNCKSSEIARVGKPFRMLRDPARPQFGWIDRVRVTFTDGTSAVVTVAELNRIRRATEGSE